MYPLPPRLQLQAQAQAQVQAQYAHHAQSHPQPQLQPQSQTQSQIQNHHQNPTQNINQSANSNANTNPTKTRPSASCTPCRNRKVKCDRLTPCSTCLSRAHPEQCTYTTTDIDRTAMKSAETIADLRRKIRALKMQISEDENGNSGTDGGSEGRIDWRELEAMETVFGEMREEEEGVVEGIVGMVREGVGMGELAGFIGDLRESLAQDQGQGLGQGVVEVV
ncbi:Zn(II)2Cys6 transcription factor domain-containing protein [Aspergillus glaucus CBS 516.65]|uniref:Zn(2)-C6 fungal-type domain-containing protein n=1 Tax=Aspergillus glaucus CBS 516.65 TaxID=1160497 RepID=A0A1L9VKY6_ASPGL|nr:hypothetical protein ASPGLDRAFT_46484 [Aspergillus glaucus CBS 516.65]OJJ84589.1 hypothetical protein ASPGLDRAFT_46484 [Aspergillus glaucus CBS 516.65]